ncbi:MAG: LysR family transcriptional regulator [Eubacteriales bacterium]|nr:LysR family transcriptional regulator [Eubacteriales bacterium]
MYLKDQQYMVALADSGSITNAARMLSISQPALSKWISRLEASLGVALVIRSGRRLIFTEAGQIYLDGCREALSVASAMREKIRAASGHSGKQLIILGGSPIRGAQAFAKLYPEFHKQYPLTELRFTAGTNTELKKLLSQGQITMSLLGAMEPTLPDLEFLKFMDEELLMLIPKEHPLAYDYSSLPPNSPYPVIELADLSDTPILSTEATTSYSGITDELYRSAGLERNIIFRSSILPLLYEMVLSNVGAALIPDSYFNPEDGLSAYSLSPRLIAYQGIGLRPGYPLSEEEEYLLHLVMNSWGSPYYLHQYADYYLEQRKQRIALYERNEF